jgi:protein-disulfide isomerase
MSKRQEIRARRRRERLRNRIFVILLVAAGALLIVSAFILPTLKTQNVGNIIQITPVAYKAPVDKNSIGNPNASVKVEVWADFQCPGCGIYARNVGPLIIKNYVETGKVFYTYHFFPVVETYMTGGRESSQAANAAMCAAEQGRFWDYHDMLFANQNGENAGGFADARLVAFARALALKMSDFNRCFNEKHYADSITQDFATGQAEGIQGTPSIFVNGTLVNASYDQIAQAIEAALAGK